MGRSSSATSKKSEPHGGSDSFETEPYAASKTGSITRLGLARRRSIRILRTNQLKVLADQSPMPERNRFAIEYGVGHLLVLAIFLGVAALRVLTTLGRMQRFDFGCPLVAHGAGNLVFVATGVEAGLIPLRVAAGAQAPIAAGFVRFGFLLA